MAGAMQVYTESGAKRAFAGAIEWPGWCRSGRRESDALDRLIEYAPRYADVVSGSVRGFKAPRVVSDLAVVERLRGDATTDFGAPAVAPTADGRPLDARELKRVISILEASWTASDRVVEAAAGTQLRKGPRGGGRELATIVDHVIGAEGSYVAKLAAPRPKTEGRDPRASPILRSSRRLARARSRVGDRGSRRRRGLRKGPHLVGSHEAGDNPAL